MVLLHFVVKKKIFKLLFANASDQNTKYVEMERPYLFWRMQIVKSFAIPKFISKASLIYVSNDLQEAVNKEFFNFIWKERIKDKMVSFI